MTSARASSCPDTAFEEKHRDRASVSSRCQKSSCKSRRPREGRDELPRSLGPTVSSPLLTLAISLSQRRASSCPRSTGQDRSLSFLPSSSGVALSGASFRPSPPNNRLGIHLIDRFTAPEDILLLRYTRHVSFLALLLTLSPSFRVQFDDYPSLRTNLSYRGIVEKGPGDSLFL